MKHNRWLFPLGALLAALVAWGFEAANQRTPEDPLIAGFRKAAVASVADAVDQVVGQRGYMSHDMHQRTGDPFVGRAVTALLKPATPEQATPQLSAKHSVGMIDEAKPGEVGIIVIENGLDVAGIGMLMATTAKARGMAGIVVDGGMRDAVEVRPSGFPIFSRSVVPSSTVGRWASVASNIPVECAGVTVKPGDIIVAGEDGVVSVPQEKAAEVLKRAQEIDQREDKMIPLIKKYKALGKVIQIFNRI